MAAGTWPSGPDAVEQYYRTDLLPAIRLWESLRVESRGSGRRSGPRHVQWAVTIVAAYASLEAGLENLMVAAHGHRTGKTGHATLSRKLRKYLVEQPLAAPNAAKIERLLFSQFGIELGALTDPARFTVRQKRLPHAGSGRGERKPSPVDWSGLRELLAAVSYIRNAVAHGDTRRQSLLPSAGSGPAGAGLAWVQKADGTWSVQQPHALTGIRTTIAAYNAVAASLDAAIGFLGGATMLESPDDLIDYT